MRRIFQLKEGAHGKGPVVYWMSRDQRTRDNWALAFAQETAVASKAPLVVAFCLVPEFLHAGIRQYAFMLKGLREVETSLQTKNIPFFLLTGEPGKTIPSFLKRLSASCLITDFDPLRIKRQWKKDVTNKASVPVYEVDAHNIIPCWYASQRQEYGAFTFRKKVDRLLPSFLDDIPATRRHPYAFKKPPANDWEKALFTLSVDTSVKEVKWAFPGERAAKKALRDFIARRLNDYPARRNDPSENGQSGLSPYLHFGMLSAQRAAKEVIRSKADPAAKEAFLEELVVRRELSDNFCFQNMQYDSFEGFPDWAKRTLNKHRKDKRKGYPRETLERGETADELWNAAQKELLVKGKMHGYMRMYWGKKLLEWASSPEEAMRVAVHLNDKYSLDGRDPNGYTGIAWCIGGVHDRPWPERPIYGTVRYMSAQGAAGKFDTKKYIAAISGMKEGGRLSRR